MSDMLKNVSKGSFFLTVESMSAVVSGLLYSVFSLRWLGPSWFGVLSLALSVVGLASVFTGNFEAYLERYAAEYDARGQHVRLLRVHLWALAVKAVLGMLAAYAVFALLPWIATQYQGFLKLDVLVKVLLAMVVFEGFTTTGRATLYGLQQYSWIAGLALLQHTLKLAFVIYLANSHRGPTALALALAGIAILNGFLSTGLAFSIAWRKARGALLAGTDQSPNEGAVAILRNMFRYCLPLLGARAAFISGQNLSRVVLGKFFTSDALGLFSFAFQTVERFVGLVFAIPSSLLPSLTQLVARGEDERMRRLLDKGFRLVATLACALSFCLFVFAEEITRIVGGHRYLPAVGILRILALVPWVRTAQQPLTMGFYALRRTGMVLGLAVVKFMTEMGSYFILIPLIGLAGAAWANLLGALAAFFGALACMRVAVPGPSHYRGAVIAKTGFLVALGAACALFLAATSLDWRAVFAVKLAFVLPALIVGVATLDLVTDDDLARAEAMEIDSRWKLALRNGSLRFVRSVRALALRVRPRSFATAEGH
jgi:O-antigen/teichoic acid export membrane protein